MSRLEMNIENDERVLYGRRCILQWITARSKLSATTTIQHHPWRTSKMQHAIRGLACLQGVLAWSIIGPGVHFPRLPLKFTVPYIRKPLMPMRSDLI